MSSWNDNLSQKMERFSMAGPGTGGFWANVGIIRPAAWAIAVMLGCGFEIFLYFVAFRAEANPHGAMPLAVKIFLGIVGPFFIVAMVLLHGYIYADAKRRGMRAVMWTILSVLVPYLIGSILYFLLREPMPMPCSKCGYMARRRFAFCPQCGTPLNRICGTCSRSLEPGWAACAYCGTPVAVPVAAKV